MTLATDLAIRKWKPTKDGEAIGTGGRTGLYVRGWKTGTKAFYFRAKTWIKMGDYPDTSLAMARELSTVAKRLAREGFGVDALSRGFANATTATELEAVIKGEVLAGFADVGATNAPTYNDLWSEWYEGRKHKLQEGPSRRSPEAIDRSQKSGGVKFSTCLNLYSAKSLSPLAMLWDTYKQCMIVPRIKS